MIPIGRPTIDHSSSRAALVAEYCLFFSKVVSGLKLLLGRSALGTPKARSKELGLATLRHKQRVSAVAALVDIARDFKVLVLGVVVFIRFFRIDQLALVVYYTPLLVVLGSLSTVHGFPIGDESFLGSVGKDALGGGPVEAQDFPTSGQLLLVLAAFEDDRAVGRFGNGSVWKEHVCE